MVTWPAEPVVARAYIDQLQRDDAIGGSLLADLNAALDSADARLADGARDRSLTRRLNSLAERIGDDGNAMTVKRKAALTETLTGIAARLP